MPPMRKRSAVKLYSRGAPTLQRSRVVVDRSLAAQQQRIAAIRARIPRAPAIFTSRQGEVKAIDIPRASQSLKNPATGTNCILLNGVQAGAGFFNRVGSKIEMKNIHLRGALRYAATEIGGQARLLVVYDRQPTGALPVISDLLQARDQTGAATNTGLSEINLDNRDRFAIIRDMTYYVPPCTYTAGVLTNGPQFPGQDDQQWDVNEFIRLKGLATHFKSSSNPTTIADIATGALYAFFVTTGSDAVMVFDIGFRVRYTDM